jgi:DNA-binding NarL/FixJ family response regulator
LSQHTVKNHVSSILIKLQVENRIQAAVRAVRGGLV